MPHEPPLSKQPGTPHPRGTPNDPLERACEEDSGYLPDILPGFEQQAIELIAEEDGELCATLVRRVAAGRAVDSQSAPAVLYLHGFSDYFFQQHVADAFEDAGLRFYALDLRRSGRSLRPGNLPYQARSVDDFFVELDATIDIISQAHRGPLFLMGHSTGGLISSLYAKRGSRSSRITGLVLNSPFLEFRASRFERLQLTIIRPIGRTFPRLRVPQRLETAYGRVTHRNYGGEWDYDLAWKPLSGSPLRAGWFTMTLDAHDEIKRGLQLRVPVLLLHSSHSHRSSNTPEPRDLEADTVLAVESMCRLGPRLGDDVRLGEIEGALHDLALSQQPARQLALEQMTTFCRRIAAGLD